MSDLFSLPNANKLPRACLVKMQAVYPTLKRAEKQAADIMLKNPEYVASSTIVETSSVSGCSETTWFRLAKRLGYSGFHEMKADMSQYLRNQESSEEQSGFYDNIDENSTTSEVAAVVFESSIAALRDTLALIDEKQYAQAIDAICGAKRIVLSGVGDAYAVVKSAYQKLFLAGFNVYESSDQDLQLLSISHLEKRDVVIAISYSGKTKNIVDLVKYAREKEAIVIAITNFPVSPLAKNSDILLLTAAFSKHSSGEIVSKRITQMCVVESLYINLLNRKDLNLKKNIASSHEALKKNKI